MGLDARTLLILLLIALILFGASRLPQLARSLGRSARILKAETKGLTEEDDSGSTDEKSSASEDAHQQQATPSTTQERPDSHAQQAGQAELPAGQYVVDENGRPVRHVSGNEKYGG
ncbi:sec-independent protein translocase protein TatA [Haloactinospora alba]|uniref:Sec-independent protein translocase protein TatA n=1 Tax=Haloactinospora alba TaxID=405555 RepID=A0A543NJ38_9ACTN|nr:twin-arginine translocase TatA/TatE family subunit [Haloactinospora alba]TQN31774.1 sec-independent protein translocase protein TatA [Haloactinospora alba]